MNIFRRKPAVTEKVAVEPESVQASSIEEYFNRGMVYYSQGKFEQAVRDFQQANSMDTKAIDPYYGLGLVYRAQEKNTDAISAFEQVLELINQGALEQNFDKKNMLQRICRSHIRSLTENQ